MSSRSDDRPGLTRMARVVASVAGVDQVTARLYLGGQSGQRQLKPATVRKIAAALAKVGPRSTSGEDR